MQMTMNSIQEFHGTKLEATIPWLDHIEGVTKKTGFDPVEIGMSKLKGMAHRALLKHSTCITCSQCICPPNAR